MSKLMIVMMMLAIAAPAVARQAPHPNTRLGALRFAPPADPYGKLFAVQRGVKAAGPAAKPAAQPKVVCGMTIIEAAPFFDRKIITPSQDGNLKYTIRAIDPAICNPSR